MSEGYNGYTNWETWNLNLWASNDENLYRNIRGKHFTDDFAEAVGWEAFPQGTPDMDGVEDMAKVDWQEIADAWNEME